MIHFNDDSICFGIPPETMCCLTHKYVHDNTFDLIYYKSVKSVTCKDCKYRLIKERKLSPTRLELIND